MKVYPIDAIKENTDLLSNVVYVNFDLFIYDGWQEFIIDGFIERMESMGIHVYSEDVIFDVSCSQSDGASFTSNSIDLEKLMRSLKIWSKYRSLHKYIKDDSVTMTIVRDSFRDCHANSISCEISRCFGLIPNEERLFYKAQDLNDEIETEIRYICNDLYKELVNEIDFLESASNVYEALSANDYKYITENGQLLTDLEEVWK